MADFDPTFTALLERHEALQQDAIREGRRAIRTRLRELNDLFPRHRFSWIDGMGTAFVEVAPKVFGHTILRHAHIPGPVGEFLTGFEDRIHEEIATPLGDEFRIEFGVITTENEEED